MLYSILIVSDKNSIPILIDVTFLTLFFMDNNTCYSCKDSVVLNVLLLLSLSFFKNNFTRLSFDRKTIL